MAIPAYLPSDYIPGESERLSWYKKLAMAQKEEDLSNLREELLDRYGKLPNEVKNLLEGVRLKIWMRKLKIPRIEADENSALISFDQESRINFDYVIEQVKSNPKKFRLTPKQELVYWFQDKEQKFEELRRFFKEIEPQG